MQMKTTKREWRALIAQRKKTYTPQQLDQWSSSLLAQLEDHPVFRRAQTILMYYSLPDEVQTHAFVERWNQSKRIILPVVKGDELELRLYQGKESLKKGAYGIEEPIGPLLTDSDYNEIALAIIPGVSFDAEGNRLGRGKGYYDRLLPQLSAHKIGICFQFQVADSLPAETFDIQMDEVWTENGCISRTQCSQ